MRDYVELDNRERKDNWNPSLNVLVFDELMVD